MHDQKCVLLVEDDERLRYALSRYLEADGFDVIDVADANSALAAVDSGAAVDIIVTDIMLEHSAHGISLAQMARMRRRGLPALFITAFPENLVHAKAHGPLMVKPIDPALLVLKIRHELGR